MVTTTTTYTKTTDTTSTTTATTATTVVVESEDVFKEATMLEEKAEAVEEAKK